MLSKAEERAVEILKEGGKWSMPLNELVVNIEESYRVRVRFGETFLEAVERQVPKWLMLALSKKNPLPGLPFLWDVTCHFRMPILDACIVRVRWNLKSPLSLLPNTALKIIYAILKPLSKLNIWILGTNYR